MGQQRIGWCKGENWLAATGLLGFALALVCAVWALAGGADRPPDGNLWKAFSFNAALGVFLLSTAAIIPLSGMGRRGKAFFRWSYIGLALYSYFVETVQHIRGVNPRFAEDGSLFDVIAAGVFALVALLLVVIYLFFALQFFKRTTYEANPELVLGIRYAMVSIMVAFAGGISISMNGGRFIGAEGNLIWLHGMGFHAIQALPFIAWLAAGSALPATFRRTLIHVSGIAFFLGLLAMGWQTLLGLPLLEWSALPLATAACFILVTAAGARSLFAERQRRTDGKGISA